jgi:hypothetical protein
VSPQCRSYLDRSRKAVHARTLRATPGRLDDTGKAKASLSAVDRQGGLGCSEISSIRRVTTFKTTTRPVRLRFSLAQEKARSPVLHRHIQEVGGDGRTL